ncbi:zinc finger protein 429-like isoform X1 [Drosophila willistoni]|nr:zinc finger protein 429-like isoform X1 [Drosophila willistoni]XP_046865137.1 zinc finger protein 429-like isoform X1 [Drosophila willistoni]
MTTMQLNELLCRVCLQQDELMVDIYEKVEELQMDLSSLLDKIGSIDIKLDPTDAYPKYLCQECTNELLISARFQKKCLETKQMLSKLKGQKPMEVEPDVNHLLAEEIIEFDPIDYAESFEPCQQDEQEATTKQSKPIYSCDKCGAVFQLTLTLHRHLEKCHSDAKIYECQKCGHAYTDNENFQRHCCKDSIADSSSRQAHRCSLCGKCLKSPSSLVMHMRLHNGERPFACANCPKSFKTNGALVSHQKRHQQLPCHVCPHCDRGFVESSNLRRHIQSLHTDERPHTCTICQRKFSRVYLLQLHSRTHTGERPYACSQCDRRFAQLAVLRNHETTHSQQRPHRCAMCPKTFGRTSQLKKHELSHISAMNPDKH